jgi:dodecin
LDLAFRGGPGVGYDPNFKEAVDEGMNRAGKTLRGITGFQVLSLKGKVEKGKIVEYRVTMEVTFILD